MKYRAVVHRRFQDDDGAPYLYVATSASIMRLDETSTEILTAFQNGGADAESWLDERSERDDAAELRETFRDMVGLGIIRPEAEVPPPASELPPMPYPLGTLVLNVTNKCNLSCTYCYEYGEDRIADGPAEGGAKAPMMSPETACQSVEFLFRTSGTRKHLNITFFGGETLLNFKAIEAAAKRALELAGEQGRSVSFSLTTNATLLTDGLIKFLVAHRFGINVSIDGNIDDQDRHRTFKSGQGSFDIIVPRIQKLIETNKAAGGRPIGARVTLTRGSASVRDIYNFLHGELGFAEVGFAPVTSAKDRDYSLVEGDYDKLIADFTDLSDDFVEAAARGDSHGFSNLNDLLRELHQGINKAHPCGAGLGLLGVSTEGNLALCHRFVESGTHEVGTIEDGIDEEKRADFLQQAHINSKTDCNTCFARPHCSGGCYHEAYVRHGDATKANMHYCEWVRAWTDLGLTSYARIMARNSAFFERYESA